MARVPSVGKQIIRNMRQLRRSATAAVARFRLAEHPGMQAFARARPMEPLLVSDRSGGARASYYLVPFQIAESGIQAAMILNAYTGEYEQSIVLSPDCFFKFVAKKKVTRLTSDRFQIKKKWLRAPELVFIPSLETPDRFFPVWQVRDTRQNQDIYITPRAEVVLTLANTDQEFWRRFN